MFGKRSERPGDGSGGSRRDAPVAPSAAAPPSAVVMMPGGRSRRGATTASTRHRKKHARSVSIAAGAPGPEIVVPLVPFHARVRQVLLTALMTVTGGSLRARITLLTGTLALLLSLAMSLAVGITARSWVENDAGRSLGRDARHAAEMLEHLATLQVAASNSAAVSPTFLRTALSDLTTEGDGFYVFDRQGRVIVAPSGSHLTHASLADLAALANLAPARGGAQGFARVMWPATDNDTSSLYLTGFGTLRAPDGSVWTVLTRRPFAAALAPARSFQTQALLFSLLAGLACALCAYRVAGVLTEQARAMASIADRVRAGDRNAAARMPLPALGRGAAGDEIARLGGAVGALVRALTRREQELEKANKRLQEELAERERVLAERARLMAEVQVASLRQRRVLRDLLQSVTEDRLRLCDSDADLPERLPHRMTGCPVPLAKASLRILRHAANEAATSLNMEEERRADLLLGVGEAGMNAVVHAGGGVGSVYHDGTSRVQVWVTDRGKGIAEENIPRATLEKGYTTAGTMGHGFPLILRTCDRVWLLTGPNGTTVVLEKDLEEPQMSWLRARGLDVLASDYLKS